MHDLIFRADGDARLGLGHVMRCLALADMLKHDFRMRFATVAPAPALRSLIENAGLTLVALPNPEAFLDALDTSDVVVLDGYLFDADFQEMIREKARKLVFIDDLLTGRQVADVVINHSGNVTADDYAAEPYTQFCLGPHYALLRPDFLHPPGVESPGVESPDATLSGATSGNGTVFVSLGGADPQNYSLTVLEGIRQADATLPVRLVLGPFHPDRASIEAFQSKLPNLTILQNRSAAQMADELRQCQLAITACSTIAYEVCAMNRPLIGVVTAENQDRIAQFLSDEKLALSVNFPTLLTRLIPVIALDKLIRLAIQSVQFTPENATETLVNQRRFFDGRSPERFRRLFQELTA